MADEEIPDEPPKDELLDETNDSATASEPGEADSADDAADGVEDAGDSPETTETEDLPPSQTPQPRGRRGWLKRVLVAAIALTALAVTAYILSTRRDPLVTKPIEAPARVLIRNVAVVDVVAGTRAEGLDVVIEGDTIKSISAHAAKPPPAGGTRVIEGSGKTLIPGLIDIHCHLATSPAAAWERKLPNPERNMQRLLFSGVTRVFDPGSATPDIFELRASVNAGKQLGPTIYAAGPVFTAPGGHPIPMLKELLPGLIADRLAKGMTREIANQQDVTAAMDELAPHKPDFIKLAIDRIPLDAPRLDPAVAAMLVKDAKARGIRTVAHIGTTKDAIAAADAGSAAWIHGVYKERIADEDIAKLAAFNIPMVPTLIVFRSFADLGTGSLHSTDLERLVMDGELLDRRSTTPDDWEISQNVSDFISMLAGQQRNALSNVRRLAAAGVTIMAGSDAQSNVIHGPALHRELTLLSKAGLSPSDVLRAATLHPARFLSVKEDPPFGIVAANKRADLLLVNGNPLEAPAAISNIAEVIVAGVVLERHPLQP